MGSLIFSFAALIVASPALASFQNTPSSVKAESMGGAFVAKADDASTVFINPAGLANLEHPEISMMYGKPLLGLEGVDLNQGYLALGVPINERWALGLSASIFRASGLISEYVGSASASMRVGEKIAVGAGASYLYHKYDIASDPAYSSLPAFAKGNSKGAVGVSLGLMSYLTPRVQFGASLRNINRPDVGLQERDLVPMEIRIGTLYRGRYASFQFELEQGDDGLATQSSTVNTYKLGAEIPLGLLAVRAGVNNHGLSAGFGLAFGALSIDYAFSLLREVAATNYGNQLLAISFKLGGEDEASKKEEPKEKSQPRDPWLY